MKRTITMTSSEFTVHAIRHIADTLNQAWCKIILERGIDDRDYKQDWGFDLLEPTSTAEFIDRAQIWIDRICEIDASFGEKIAGLMGEIRTVSEKNNLLEFANFYRNSLEVILTKAQLCSDIKSISGVGCALTRNEAIIFLPAEHAASYLQAAAELLRKIAKAGRLPTVEEYISIAAAEYMLERGQPLTLPIIAWGKPGFRKHQTLMSITDPGPGHLHGTCLSLKNMDGVIVHIEHLERGVNIPRSEIEPYRIPPPRIVPRVCLRAASMAPVSTYVGRAMFDGDVNNSMLKTARTFAAACNSFFADRITECKIAIDGMTASQAIYFLKAVMSNTRRDHRRQVLSVAICLNAPIIDDRSKGEAREVISRFDIGMLGIEIAHASGIEKVTWDGTADTYPSQCIIEQLGFEDALTLVHAAHERGLLTYFSAGFRFHHIADTVLTGVDGIGIGGAQILRYMDYANGNHGPFKAENIREILNIRNEAEQSLLGRATKLLARLDHLYHAGNLTGEQNGLRQNLFVSLRKREESTIKEIISRLEKIVALPDELPIWLPNLPSKLSESDIVSGEKSELPDEFQQELLGGFVVPSEVNVISNQNSTDLQ